MERVSILSGILALVLLAGYAEGAVTWSFEVIEPERTARPGEWIQWQYRITNSAGSTHALHGGGLSSTTPPPEIHADWTYCEPPPSDGVAPGESFEGNHVAWQVDPDVPPGTVITAELRIGILVYDPFSYYFETAPIQIVVEDSPGTVNDISIDIKPCTDLNTINLTSKGVVPVAVLGTDEFDVNTIDLTTATIDFAGASLVKWTIEDVGCECGENDGYEDLLLFFEIQDLNLDENSTEATLVIAAAIPTEGTTTGATMQAEGTTIQGKDVVHIVSNGSKSKQPAAKTAAPLVQSLTWGQIKSAFRK